MSYKKNVYTDNRGHNIINDVKKSGKIGQDYKIYISFFA